MIKRTIQVGLSALGLGLRILLGCKLRFHMITLISFKASLKTRRGGEICLGYRSSIRQNTEISATGGTIDIKDKCFINRNSLIVAHQKIVIGSGTTIGPGVYIYDHDHDGKGDYKCEEVIIGDNVWIGAGCIILKGVHIGANSVIGAGSLVVKDVPDNCIFYQKRSEILRERVI